MGDAWRVQWQERLDRLPFLPAIWLRHQHYDGYWQHGSVCEDYSAVNCAVLAVGGWSDAYSNAVPRLVAGLNAPCRGIIGPWAHIYPHDGVPGPAIGFLQEAVRWWTHWLKDQDTGVMAEPALRAYVQEAVVPAATRREVPGRWVGETNWPSPHIKGRRLHLLADGSLGEDPGAPQWVSLKSPLSHGKAAGEWMGAGVDGEQPTDQRLDDGGALTFDSGILDEPIEILGAPVLHLELSSDAPVAQLCARLSDVLPDGRVTRVSYQVLNLCHRDGHRDPSPLVVNQVQTVSTKLNDCGHRFLPGHRIRVALASAYWPIVWPSPKHATLSLRLGEARLELPERRGEASPSPVTFQAPEQGPPAPTRKCRTSTLKRYSTQDHLTGDTLCVTEGSGGLFGEGVLYFEEPDVRINHSLRRELRIRDDDPLSARARYIQSYEMGRPGWEICIQTDTELTSTATDFAINGDLRVELNGELVSERQWRETIPRSLV